MAAIRGQEARQESHVPDQREYYRVVTCIPFRYRRPDPDEIDELVVRIETRSDPDFAKIDPALSGWLDRIERKLECVLAHLEACDSPPLRDQDTREVSLSGSGMRFLCEDEIPPGTEVLLEFELPGTPAHRVSCLGRVVDPSSPGETSDGKNQTAVEFCAIREIDRDAIVRHALEIQRRDLQLRNSSESDSR